MSSGSLDRAKRVVNTGTPDLVAAVDDGTVTLTGRDDAEKLDLGRGAEMWSDPWGGGRAEGEQRDGDDEPRERVATVARPHQREQTGQRRQCRGRGQPQRPAGARH